MHRLVALIVLTAAFAPAAILGALPLVMSVVAVLLATWFILATWAAAADPVVEPPVTPLH